MRSLFIFLCCLAVQTIVVAQNESNQDNSILYENFDFGYQIRAIDSSFELSIDDSKIFKFQDNIYLEFINRNHLHCTEVFQKVNDSLSRIKLINRDCRDSLSAGVSSKLSLTILDDSILVLNDLYPKFYGQNNLIKNEPKYVRTKNQTSSIFVKSSDKNWIRKTEFYSSIVCVKSGYIVTIQEDNLILLADSLDSSNSKTNQYTTNTRFIFLQKNLKAKSFLDYYDFNNITDLGFGLQFETDNGAFFVTYDGKALTNDEWESFEIENDQLKAIGVSKIEYFVF